MPVACRPPVLCVSGATTGLLWTAITRSPDGPSPSILAQNDHRHPLPSTGVVAFDLAAYNKLPSVHAGCLPSFLRFVSAIVLGKNVRPRIAAMVRSALLLARGRGSIQPHPQKRSAVTTEKHSIQGAETRRASAPRSCYANGPGSAPGEERLKTLVREQVFHALGEHTTCSGCISSRCGTGTTG